MTRHLSEVERRAQILRAARAIFIERGYLAARVEYYQDEQGVIIATGTPKDFRTLGYSLNFDQWVNPNVLWRIEARSLSSEDPVFVDADGGPSTTNTFFTASIAFSIP